ncbi:hypothetical protein MBLNU459_g6626t1 [Dothideomycetes sp. NU459]
MAAIASHAKIGRVVYRSVGPIRSRPFSTSNFLSAKRLVEDEIHRPSLGGSSLGHLLSEISSMKPGMEALRPEGQTMSEEQRTFARRVVTWMMGLPVLLSAGIVGTHWIASRMEGNAAPLEELELNEDNNNNKRVPL